MEIPMRLMISYSRQDSVAVSYIEQDLRKHKQFLIDHPIGAGQRVWSDILNGIYKAECILVMLSWDAIECIYWQEALKYAVALNKPIIPVMLRPCQFPEILNNRPTQYIEANKLTTYQFMPALIESLT